MFVTIQKDMIVNLKRVDIIKQRMINGKKIIEVGIMGSMFKVDEGYIKDIMKAIESYKDGKLTKQFYAG